MHVILRRIRWKNIKEASLLKKPFWVFFFAIVLNLTGCSYYFLQMENTYPNETNLPCETKVIAFGSCFNQARSPEIWKYIQQCAPDVFIWVGDIIYPDWPVPMPGDIHQRMAHKYALVENSAPYKNFTASTPIIGIYDDHDFGLNNGGKFLKGKQKSQEFLLDFLHEPKLSQRRKQEGAYTSYDLTCNSYSIKIILLDTRYFRDAPGEESDILGPVQWQWLENTLIENDADITLIISSYSVLSDDNAFEGWSKFPLARKHLLQMLTDIPQKNVLFLSGDKHFAEFNTFSFNNITFNEFVSSGLTHTEKPPKNYVNAIDTSLNYQGINFGILDLSNLEDQGIQLRVMNQTGKSVLTKCIAFHPSNSIAQQ